MKYLTVKKKWKFSLKAKKIAKEVKSALESTILDYCKDIPRDKLEILNACRPYIGNQGQRILVGRQLLYSTISKLVKEDKLREV